MKKISWKAIYALTWMAILVLAAHIPASSTVFLAGAKATPQCLVTELTSGLQFPLGITQSNQGNLLVSESGTRTPNTGRIAMNSCRTMTKTRHKRKIDQAAGSFHINHRPTLAPSASQGERPLYLS